MKYEIGLRIKAFRERKGLSQKEFAERLGVSNGRVSNWEVGVNRPDVDLIASICEILEIPADVLLGRTTPETYQFNLQKQEVIGLMEDLTAENREGFLVIGRALLCYQREKQKVGQTSEA